MARCKNCGHGYGVHQTPSKPLRMRSGEPIRVWTTNYAKQPLVCCNRQCDCEHYVKREGRWIKAQKNSRKYCWKGEDGLPACGKEVDRVRPGRDIVGEDFVYEPSSHYVCAGCKRWLDAHPGVLEAAGYLPRNIP